MKARLIEAVRVLRPGTLAGRLALGGVAWLALWALALLLAFNVLLSHVLGGQVDTTLRARAEAVRATIDVSDGQLHIEEGQDVALDAGTSIYLGTSRMEGIDLSPGLRDELVQQGSRVAEREKLGPVRYVALPITSRRQQIGTIVVSSAVTSLSETAVIVGAASVVFIALLLAFTFFALRATVHRAMRPVRVMGDQASAWGANDIDRRFDLAAGPQELRRLATTLNGLLERIAAVLRHERRFTAELSHELRTPLAHLHAEVDLLTESAETTRTADVEGLNRLGTSIRRLEGLVETALAPARVRPSGSAGLGRMSDVLDDLPDPPSPDVVVTVSGSTDVMLAVEADVARRALMPVLENAWRYAVHEVHIDVGTAGRTATIAVSDDGGALDPEHRGEIFEPGYRADPGDDHPGAGLGLALTRRICRSAGGDATATATGGRTTIILEFPYLPE
jgi:two-component system, OmpR family, heavy metal sensor histidine kinase CusS